MVVEQATVVAVLGGLLSLAFYTGRLSMKVDTLRETFLDMERRQERNVDELKTMIRDSARQKAASAL